MALRSLLLAATAVTGALAQTPTPSSTPAIGVIRAFAGVGGTGNTGDGGAATSATITYPGSVVRDAWRRTLVTSNSQIRIVDSGIITSLVTGLTAVRNLALNAAGTFLIAVDSNAFVVRSVDLNAAPPSSSLAIFAGTLNAGGVSSGDDGLATGAKFNRPWGAAFDSSGYVWISDMNANCLRRVNLATRIISAGVGGCSVTAGYVDGARTSARFYGPTGITFDPTRGGSGSILVADQTNYRIRRVDLDTMVVSTLAGGGSALNDGFSALTAQFSKIWNVAVDRDGQLYIADQDANRIRKVDTAGIISTVVGTGVQGSTGDGGQATNAKINNPQCAYVDVSGDLVVCDTLIGKIRVVSGITSGVPTPTPSRSVTPTSTLTGTPSSTLTGTPTSTGTPSSSLTGTPSSSLTGTPSSSLTGTPSSSLTGTPSSSLTGTPSSSASPRAPTLHASRLSTTGITAPGAVLRLGDAGDLAFPAHASASGRELFTLPAGDAPATLLADVQPGAGSSEPAELARLPDGSVAFAARPSADTPAVLAVVSPGGSACTPAIDAATLSSAPAQLTALFGALFFAAADSEGVPRVWRIDAARVAAGLCDGEAVAPAAVASLAAVSRPTACGGRLVFIGRASAESLAALFSLDEAAATADGDIAAVAALPEWAAPTPPADGGELAPYPRCVAGGAAFAFAAGAEGTVAVVAAATGAVTRLAGLSYSGAQALAPAGAGLCFSGLTSGGRVLLCTPTATGSLAAAGGGVTLPPSVNWALSAGGRVWLPCYTAEGSGPHPCAYAPATGRWLLNSGITSPYSSFSAPGDDAVYFAGAAFGGGGSGIGLWRAAASQ